MDERRVNGLQGGPQAGADFSGTDTPEGHDPPGSM